MANALTTSPLVHDLPAWSTTSSLDIRSWLMKLEQLKFALGSTDEQIIRFVALKVNCTRSINYVGEQISAFQRAGAFDWTSFSAAMIAEFDVVADDWQVEASLSIMRQKPSQSLLSYAKDFELEASRCPELGTHRRCNIFISTLVPQSLQATASMFYANARMTDSQISVLKLAASLASLVGSQGGAALVRTPLQDVSSSSTANGFEQSSVPFRSSNSSYRDNRGHQGSWNGDRRWSNGQSGAGNNTLGGRFPQPSSVNQSTFQSQQDARRVPECFTCGSKQHYARDCPSRSRPPPPARTVASIKQQVQERSCFTTEALVNKCSLATVLVDTGSQANVIQASCVEGLYPTVAIQRSNRQLTGPNDEPLSVIGVCWLTIELLDYKASFTVLFTVVTECVSDIILGEPFIKRHVQSISGSNGAMTFNTCVSECEQSWFCQAGSLIGTPITPALAEVHQHTVQVPADQVVRPWSTIMITFSIQSDDPYSQVVLFTPTAAAGIELGLGALPFMVNADLNLIQVPITNPRPHPLRLPGGLSVGTVQAIIYDESRPRRVHFNDDPPSVVAVIKLQPDASSSAHDPPEVMSSSSLGQSVDAASNSGSLVTGSVGDIVSSNDVTIPLPHLDQAITLPQASTLPMTPDQVQAFQNLVLAFSHVFGKLLHASSTTLVYHEIVTTEQRPIAVRPYRTPVHLRDVLQTEITAMLGAGVIIPSYSPWSAPVVLVSKKDGSQRVCIDYRRLNTVTVRDLYPLPRIQDILDSLAGRAHVFSSLDLLSGFWQVEVHPRDRAKTAFSTENGHFEFVKMPFGLCNSPATFQRLMDVLLQDVRGFALCYIDDIIIYSETFDAHLVHLQTVFNLLISANLLVKPSKCQFFKTTIRFLGHQVSSGIVQPDPDKVSVIQTWPVPTNRHGLQVALGLFNYYRRFVPGFSSIADPLNKLLRKDTPWVWSTDCEAAFTSIKQFLTGSAVLTLPDFSLDFVLYTDASATGLGAVLTQTVNGVEKVICYGSKALNAAQRKYSATDRECLAIHWAINHWRTYLLGRRFVVVTDHAALRWLFSPTRRDPHYRHDRLILDLQQYDFVVTHRAGNAHSNADALSRIADELSDPPASVSVIRRSQTGSLPARQPRLDSDWVVRDEDRDLANAIKESFEDSHLQSVPAADDSLGADELPFTSTDSAHSNADLVAASFPAESSDEPFDHPRDIELNVPFTVPTSNELASAQREDQLLNSIIRYITRAILPQDDQEAELVLKESEQCIVRSDDVLVSLARPPGASDLESPPVRPVIPVTLRPLLLAAFHDDSIAGHLGEDKTFDRIVRRFYWPAMRRDITSYVKSCDSCQRRKTPSHLGSDTIGTPVRQSGPFQRLSIDVLGPLPVTPRNNRYCLCVMDLFSRYPMVFPISNQRTTTVATVLIERVFLEHGFPSEILSDRGTNFVSRLMAEVMSLFRIRRITTLAYKPQTNGVVERMNHSLLSMISHYLAADQRDWDQWLPYVLFGFRSSPHSTLGHSPFFLMYGREPRFPLDHALAVDGPPAQALNPNEAAYLSDVAARFALAREAVTRRLDAVDRARQIANDNITRLRSFDIGDRVLRWQPQLHDRDGKSKKLAQQWEGPFMVVDKNAHHNTYELARLNSKGRISPGSKTWVCQADRLKRYYTRDAGLLPPPDTTSHTQSSSTRVAAINLAPSSSLSGGSYFSW